jgi:ribosomal protein L13E
VLNRQVATIKRQAKAANAPEAILAIRIPDICSCESDEDWRACIAATLKELEAAGLDSTQADRALTTALANAVGDGAGDNK